MMANQITVHWA